MTSVGDPIKIVVGVDGSRSSQGALCWARRQAQLTDGELHAVISTWNIPIDHGWTPVEEGKDWSDVGRSILENAIEEALGHIDSETVHRHVVKGHPVRALLDAAADADLLVVGGGGGGDSAGPPLSPVSQDIVSRAPCPVVVVRAAAGRT